MLSSIYTDGHSLYLTPSFTPLALLFRCNSWSCEVFNDSSPAQTHSRWIRAILVNYVAWLRVVVDAHVWSGQFERFGGTRSARGGNDAGTQIIDIAAQYAPGSIDDVMSS